MFIKICCILVSFGNGQQCGNQLSITNLTGHPAVIFPTGINKNNLPTSITLIGKLYDEATLLAIAKAFQDATDFNKQHPALFK